MNDDRESPECYSDPHELEALLEPGEPRQRLYRSMSAHQLDTTVEFSLLVFPFEEDGELEVKAEAGVAPNLEGLPPIIRDGRSSPWMDAKSLGLVGDRVTHPELLRTGCLYFHPASRIRHAHELLKIACGGLDRIEPQGPADPEFGKLYGKLKKAQKAVADFVEGAESDGRWTLKRIKALDNDVTGVAEVAAQIIEHLPDGRALTLQALQALKAPGKPADYVVQDLLKAYDESRTGWLLVQGLGDLSMNTYNVAFLRSGANAAESVVYAPPGEPLLDRSYTCLAQVAGEEGRGEGNWLPGGLQINRFRFSSGHPPVARLDRSDRRLAELALAISGKAVLWGGRLVQPYENIDEWSDLRHVLELPNLNPKDDQVTRKDRDDLHRAWSRQVISSNDRVRLVEPWLQRPRMLYGQSSYDDVWLFEEQLIVDPNLRRLACHGPIAIDAADLPAPPAWIDCCMRHSAYVKRTDVDQRPLGAGEYRWEPGAHVRIHVFLRRQRYPCTMIGIGRLKRNRRPALFALAVGGGTFAKSSQSIWDHARLLRDMGCQYALVFDEGQDVFQGLFESGQEVQHFEASTGSRAERPYMRVSRKRDRVRAYLRIRSLKRA